MKLYGLVPPSANATTFVSYDTVVGTRNTGVRLSKSYERNRAFSQIFSTGREFNDHAVEVTRARASAVGRSSGTGDSAELMVNGTSASFCVQLPSDT